MFLLARSLHGKAVPVHDSACPSMTLHPTRYLTPHPNSPSSSPPAVAVAVAVAALPNLHSDARQRQ